MSESEQMYVSHVGIILSLVSHTIASSFHACVQEERLLLTKVWSSLLKSAFLESDGLKR